jgi:CheY-like chemotaxis protein
VPSALPVQHEARRRSLERGEAVQQFRTTRPDVTLLDIQMARMDGIEVLTAIRGEFPDA